MKLDPVLFLNHLMYFMSCVCVYSSRINRKHIQKNHIYIQEQLFASVTIDRRRIRTTAVVNQSDVLLTLAAYSSDVPAFPPPPVMSRGRCCFALLKPGSIVSDTRGANVCLREPPLRLNQSFCGVH